MWYCPKVIVVIAETSIIKYSLGMQTKVTYGARMFEIPF
jgi:hypothetical protein